MKPDPNPITPEGIIQLGLAFWGSKTLLSAIELSVFTELAQAPLSARELTERLKLHSRGARDFFDALVSLRMLERNGDQYRNTPATDLFLDRNKPSYVGGLLEIRRQKVDGRGQKPGRPISTSQSAIRNRRNRLSKMRAVVRY